MLQKKREEAISDPEDMQRAFPTTALAHFHECDLTCIRRITRGIEQLEEALDERIEIGQ